KERTAVDFVAAIETMQQIRAHSEQDAARIGGRSREKDIPRITNAIGGVAAVLVVELVTRRKLQDVEAGCLGGLDTGKRRRAGERGQAAGPTCAARRPPLACTRDHPKSTTARTSRWSEPKV